MVENRFRPGIQLKFIAILSVLVLWFGRHEFAEVPMTFKLALCKEDVIVEEVVKINPQTLLGRRNLIESLGSKNEEFQLTFLSEVNESKLSLPTEIIKQMFRPKENTSSNIGFLRGYNPCDLQDLIHFQLFRYIRQNDCLEFRKLLFDIIRGHLPRDANLMYLAVRCFYELEQSNSQRLFMINELISQQFNLEDIMACAIDSQNHNTLRHLIQLAYNDPENQLNPLIRVAIRDSLYGNSTFQKRKMNESLRTLVLSCSEHLELQSDTLLLVLVKFEFSEMHTYTLLRKLKQPFSNLVYLYIRCYEAESGKFLLPGRLSLIPAEDFSKVRSGLELSLCGWPISSD